jgi:hypothetical protein
LNFVAKFATATEKSVIKVNVVKLSHGVIGNTSVFGTEESRFEPWWDNTKTFDLSGVFFYTIEFSIKVQSGLERASLDLFSLWAEVSSSGTDVPSGGTTKSFLF